MPAGGASGLDPIDYGAGRAKAGGKQTMPAAGTALGASAVERYREFTLDEAAPLPVDAPDDAPEPVEGSGQFEDVVPTPPERVTLCGQRT